MKSAKVAIPLTVGLISLAAGWLVFPFSSENELLVKLASAKVSSLGHESLILSMILLHGPYLFKVLGAAYTALWFTGPWGATFLVVAAATKRQVVEAVLPPYVPASEREELSIVLGMTVESPHWAVVPEKGLYAGVDAIGATSRGKTSSLILPGVEQVLAWKANDPTGKVGALFLQVKGNFCEQIRAVVQECSRLDDYVEIGLDSGYAYNPFGSALSSREKAHGIAEVIGETFGRSKEPFWAMAYTYLMSHAVDLLMMTEDWATIAGVYRLMARSKSMGEFLTLAEQRIKGTVYYTFTKEVRRNREDKLREHEAEFDEVSGLWMAPYTLALEKYCHPTRFWTQVKGKRARDIEHGEVRVGGVDDADAREYLDSLRFDLENIWRDVDGKIWSDIILSCSSITSLFDAPAVKRSFSPRKDAANRLPPMADLMNQGKIVAVNFPASSEEMISRLVGIMLKLDYQRMVMSRLESPGPYRRTMLCIDEYDHFATPRDGEFAARCREARCIRLTSYPSVSSLDLAVGNVWQSLFQSSSTKLFFGATDHRTAAEAEAICGKHEVWKSGSSLSQQGKGRDMTMDRGGGLSASINHSQVWEHKFQSHEIMQLPVGEAVGVVFDGEKVLPAERIKMRRWGA